MKCTFQFYGEIAFLNDLQCSKRLEPQFSFTESATQYPLREESDDISAQQTKSKQ